MYNSQDIVLKDPIKTVTALGYDNTVQNKNANDTLYVEAEEKPTVVE